MQKEFLVTMTKTYQIGIIADDYDRAYEIAEETPMTDLGWELIDVEYEAECE
jgi:heterodisulfide reductase subunit B